VSCYDALPSDFIICLADVFEHVLLCAL